MRHLAGSEEAMGIDLEVVLEVTKWSKKKTLELILSSEISTHIQDSEWLMESNS